MASEQIQILEENSEFLVLLKPQGLSVHNNSPSVSEFLTANGKALHFVNRLDLETSGLMVVAQRPELHEKIHQSLEIGQKTYRALLRGPWKLPHLKTTWEWPLSDKAEGRRNPQGIVADRIKCLSLVEVQRSNAYFTEALVEIRSGRQHQIRKHAALSKMAIVGDPRYNEDKYNERIAGIYKISRLHLHAEKLKFSFQNKNYLFESVYNLNSFFEVATK